VIGGAVGAPPGPRVAAELREEVEDQCDHGRRDPRTPSRR
jgi:hypothetical protein